MSRIRARAAALTSVGLLLLLSVVASAGARSKPVPKPLFKLGEYDAKTSPAIDAGSNTGGKVSFLMVFHLSQVPSRTCGGPKSATGKVYCLTAQDLGAYGTASTTGVPSNCTDDMGYPETAGAWNPALRLPTSGHINVNQTIRTEQGDPSYQIKASLNITRSGTITGTFNDTLWVSTGGDPFLGCSTGTLSLKGKYTP